MEAVAPRTGTIFDYADLDSETRIVVQQKTGEIKERIKRTASDVIEIGERLIDIKARLGHGQFGSWLKAEFDWSERTARNFMEVSDTFKTANFADLSLAPSALYAISAPSVPEAARQEVIAKAQAGEHVTHKDAKAIIERHKPAPVYEALFADEDREAEAALLDADPEPGEDESPFEAPIRGVPRAPAPEPRASVVRPEPTAKDAWEAMFSEFLILAPSVDRRGGIPALARSWGPARLHQAVANCQAVIDTFAAYRDQLREALECRERESA